MGRPTSARWDRLSNVRTLSADEVLLIHVPIGVAESKTTGTNDLLPPGTANCVARSEVTIGNIQDVSVVPNQAGAACPMQPRSTLSGGHHPLMSLNRHGRVLLTGSGTRGILLVFASLATIFPAGFSFRRVLGREPGCRRLVRHATMGISISWAKNQEILHVPLMWLSAPLPVTAGLGLPSTL